VSSRHPCPSASEVKLIKAADAASVSFDKVSIKLPKVFILSANNLVVFIAAS
jgi:hypothetical protein